MSEVKDEKLKIDETTKKETKPTQKKTTTKKTTTSTKATTPKVEKVEEIINNAIEVEIIEETPISTPKANIDNLVKSTSQSSPQVRKTRDMDELIKVVSIVNSPLVYVSKNQSGYRVDWDGNLQENWMEYRELVNMRNSQRNFFVRPWIICEWDVLKDLRVDQYYKNIIDLENLDSIFDKSPEELEETLKVVPEGVKHLIIDRAFELKREGKLDSISITRAIEQTYKVDLTV